MEYSLEQDLKTTNWILEKVQEDHYAQNLYAAMCNNEFQRLKIIPILKEEVWSCSWRYAGGIVAELQGKGDYMEWYCSGIRDVDYDEEVNKLWDKRKYVPEGKITEEIKDDLKRLGWVPAIGGDWEGFDDN
jgi:hypothetical protein